MSTVANRGDSVGMWYVTNFPTDELGAELNTMMSFKTLWNAMCAGCDFYELMNCSDSIIRERIFGAIVDAMELDNYDVVYDRWLDNFHESELTDL